MRVVKRLCSLFFSVLCSFCLSHAPWHSPVALSVLCVLFLCRCIKARGGGKGLNLSAGGIGDKILVAHAWISKTNVLLHIWKQPESWYIHLRNLCAGGISCTGNKGLVQFQQLADWVWVRREQNRDRQRERIPIQKKNEECEADEWGKREWECACVCVFVWVYVCVWAYVRVRVRVHVCVHIHADIRHARMRAHACMRIHVGVCAVCAGVGAWCMHMMFLCVRCVTAQLHCLEIMPPSGHSRRHALRLYTGTHCNTMQHNATHCTCHQAIWSKETPPPGGFSIYYVTWSRAVCERFHDEMRLSHLVVKSLTHGSWSGNIVNRKPSQGGGVLSIKLTDPHCQLAFKFSIHGAHFTWHVWAKPDAGIDVDIFSYGNR